MRPYVIHFFRERRKMPFGRDWRWHIKAANGKIVATSGEGYRNKGDAETAFAKIRWQIQNKELRFAK